MKVFIFLLLFATLWTVHSEIHSLQYIYTALSKPPGLNAPGLYQFTAMGILDDRTIDYYNSKDQRKIPTQDWMRKNLPEDYWLKGTQSRKSKEQWFNVNVNILMDRMHHNKSDLHILQWKHGCEVEKLSGNQLKFQKGFDQYSYDGEDFLSFDDANMQWVASVQQAFPTKKKWDDVQILNQYTKGYLEKECMDWLSKFVTYSEAQVAEQSRHSPPEVFVFAKAKDDKRTLTCLATGFYPKDVEVHIMRDGVPLTDRDGVTSSGILPNGDVLETYQMRKMVDVDTSDKAEYSCVVKHVTLSQPVIEMWDHQCWNCGDGDCTIQVVAGVMVTIVVVAAVLAGVAFLIRRRRIDQAQMQAPVAVVTLGQPNGTTAPLLVNGQNGQ
ncbi:class I histocompatibility antigen, F10 alpha chain-like [Megalops cyprinoides]|uniref:class I histocompatibility antigen, F10 alpha chain-like n=1 Tax=Megalops cyprinoides TaxID=118141 RepID=UPI001864D2C0|nr:class I histocompatibility antigen, F10 alpha chain-like [Megalops cyprinoides]